MRRRVAAALTGIVFVVGVAASCGDGAETSHEMTVVANIPEEGSVCADPEGTDLEGLAFSVQDDSTQVVSEGSFGPGGPPVDNPVRIPTCRFRATVRVPDRPAYAVEIAGYEPFRVTRPDLEQSDWVVYLPALPPEA